MAEPTPSEFPDTPADDFVITDNHILANSNILYRSDHYGRYAIDCILGNERSRLLRTVNIPADAPAEFEDTVRAHYEALALPAEVEIRHSDEDDEIIFEIEPGEMTVASLRRFINSRDYDNHRLSGQQGKAIDLLRFVVGHRELRAPKRHDRYAFIPLRIVRSAAAAAGHEMGFRLVTAEIYKALEDQLLSGQPASMGEIIIEDKFRLIRNARQRELSIARSSLVALADKPEVPQTAVRKFLRDAAATSITDLRSA